MTTTDHDPQIVQARDQQGELAATTAHTPSSNAGENKPAKKSAGKHRWGRVPFIEEDDPPRIRKSLKWILAVGGFVLWVYAFYFRG
jgi:hypothetical protein